MFPDRQSTQAEIARDNVTDLYLPNDVKNIPKAPAAPQPKSPGCAWTRGSCGSLPRPASCSPTPNPPEPERVVRDTPALRNLRSSAPMPQPRTQQPLQESPITAAADAARYCHEQPGLAAFFARESPAGILHEALKDGGTASAQFGGPVGRLAVEA